jgi:uncharacterized protein with GYD domain
MPIFVALGRATDQGIKNLEGMARRHEVAVNRVEAGGAKLIASYALMGPYDYLVILECPDEKIAIRVLAREASHGNVRYQTFPAIAMEEFAKLVE